MTGAADLQFGCGHVPHGCSPQIPAGKREGEAFNEMFLQKLWPICVTLLISALLPPPTSALPAQSFLSSKKGARYPLPNKEFDQCLPAKSCSCSTGQ